MIVSASRRTDIPAFYSGWLLRRLEEGVAYVRNPVNARQVSRVILSPAAVDGIVLWTKNPAPMLDMLDAMDAYSYYFQYTLNAYGKDAEPGLPPEADRVRAFQALSGRIGRHRVIWRYDPILISPKYTEQYHIEGFKRLARSLKGHTEKCIISFVDFYRKAGPGLRALGAAEIPDETKRRIAGSLFEIARACGFTMDACAENVPLGDIGIGRARCVDAELISRLAGYPVKAGKDRNQRPACGCAASVDIGTYDTCLHGCAYCYAGRPAAARRNAALYDPASPLLCSALDPADIVRDRL